jgi:hypothetical protein
MENKVKKKTISYTQFSKWFTCPRSFKLDYIDKLKQFEDNLIMSFGTAVHETMQEYLKLLYDVSEEKANELNLMNFFKTAFNAQIEKKKIPHTAEEVNGFTEDAENILGSFRQIDNRLKHFPSDKYTLVNIEHQLNLDIKNNIGIVAYLDIVLKERLTGKIRIIDIKTSTNGWNSYQKEDFTKISQLILYKALYSKQNNVPLHMIDIEFFIVKRKLYENVAYQQSHIQIFKPRSNQSDVVEVIEEVSKFINNCFTPEGEYRLDVAYPKVPGKGKKNCKFCIHKGKNCDAVPDIING